MTDKKFASMKVSYGDIVVLHTWEHMKTLCSTEHDNDKPNGNLISPHGYRLFCKEKDLYGKPHMVTKVSIYSADSGNPFIIIDTPTKREISLEEINKIIKKDNDKEYKKWEDLLV